ncbi:S1C family serine protease [Actinoplanes sp. NPDC049316]|uniref:S1C family serine protease n=1 Tax=Actinoplanes sp. NPDC049316 TaxID=3154727 RepID=UPI003438F1AE
MITNANVISGGVHVGDDVIAIGTTPSVTRGIVSPLGHTVDTETGHLPGMTQTDTPTSSDAPLIDSSGKVIGMVTATAASSRSTAVENIGFAIPTAQLLPVVKRLRQIVGAE